METKLNTSTPPRRIGLTGGIAAGKSTVQQLLEEAGVPVLDTDRVAHEVMAAGTPVHQKVVEAFGPHIVGPDGQIQRKVLGGIVFQDPDALRRLNALVHPEVGRRWRDWLHRQTAPVAVVAIPLLFEVGAQDEFDGVLCIWAPEEVMRRRLLARGLSPEEANRRMASQWSVDRKAALSDWIMKNDGTLDALRQRVREWMKTTCLLEN